MKHFRKIWNDEMHNFLLENKTMNRTELYSLFLEHFNNPDVTFTAFCNERSRIGAVNYNTTHGSTKCRPLFSEQLKKGYIRIKIAQPNVWIFKQVYIWNQHNPNNVVIPKKELVIFLDGNNRNFAIENLCKIPREIAPIFNSLGGTVKDNPAATLLNVKRAEVKHQLFNRARDFGLLKQGRFPEDIHAYYINKKNSMTDSEKQELKKKISERNKERRRKLKIENPILYRQRQDRINQRRKEKAKEIKNDR